MNTTAMFKSHSIYIGGIFVFKSLVAVCALLVLCSCSPIRYVRYQPPDVKQDAAEIFVEKIVGYYEPRTAIRTFDKEGCFSGYTYVTDSARLYANNEAFMHMWKNTDQENMCAFDYSFVPEKNAKYKATTTQISVPTGKRRLTITGWQPVERPSCELKLVQIGADGSETPVQTRGYRLTNDNQCSKLVPRKDATVTK